MSGYSISVDRARLDIDVIHGYLHTAYWCAGVPRTVVERAIAHSLCVGAYFGAAQVGFARVVSDCATFAYVADVFVLEQHRHQGLARGMMDVLMQHPELQQLRTWMLMTRDAHGLYKQVGFQPLPDPSRAMIKRDEQVYRGNDSSAGH